MNQTQYEEIMSMLRKILEELKDHRGVLTEDQRLRIARGITTPTTAYGIGWKPLESPFEQDDD